MHAILGEKPRMHWRFFEAVKLFLHELLDLKYYSFVASPYHTFTSLDK